MRQFIAALATGAMLMAAPAPRTPPLTGKVIVVDPGHGGRDSGARAGMLFESDIVLGIGKEVAQALRARGAKVLLTRTTERNLLDKSRGGNLQRENLEARVTLAEHAKADLFLSLHANKYPSTPSAHGAQVFLGENPSPERMRLGEHLMAQLGPLTDSKRIIDGKLPLYLMRHLTMTAVLIEFGFLSNPKETDLLVQTDYQRKLGEAVARGVVAFYASTPAQPDVRSHKPHPTQRATATLPQTPHRIYPSSRA